MIRGIKKVDVLHKLKRISALSVCSIFIVSTMGFTGAENEIQKKAGSKSETKILGLDTLRTDARAGNKLSDEIVIEFPCGRNLTIYQYSETKNAYVKKKSYKLPSGESPMKIKILYPNSFWKTSRELFKVSIPKTVSQTGISETVVVESKRRYQTPAKYLQISDSAIEYEKTKNMSQRGLELQLKLKNYCSPLADGVSRKSSRSQLIEIFIKRAEEYLGDPYVIHASGRPAKDGGVGIDCSGIVMQAMYAIGMSAEPSNSYRHMFSPYKYESQEMWRNERIKKIPQSKKRRGDLIFYAKEGGHVNHVAIYLGNGQVLESYPPQVTVAGINVERDHSKVIGVGRIFA